MADAFWTTGPTFYKGTHKSKIDHIAVPIESLGRIRQLHPLLGLARRLQRHVSTHLRDHVPVFVNMDIHVTRAHIPKLTPQANTDCLMGACSDGIPRAEGWAEGLRWYIAGLDAGLLGKVPGILDELAPGKVTGTAWGYAAAWQAMAAVRKGGQAPAGRLRAGARGPGAMIFPDMEGASLDQLGFMTVVYGYILMQGASLIGSGSELLLLVPRLAPLVGSVVLPVLGAVPDGMMVLMSGSGPDAQNEVAVGVGALAGSTIMLLTLPWFLAVYAGRAS
ncbi:unnamed protein product [Prorocentrum cordatum]|uniref:Uncharacterized protein n=1 Tax=Prorocentrum cordatum TaxID=2364126 RepID=A0ABN9Y8V1_9DINO|nr:unnamed protein product [Polarella glacialis]